MASLEVNGSGYYETWDMGGFVLVQQLILGIAHDFYFDFKSDKRAVEELLNDKPNIKKHFVLIPDNIDAKTSLAKDDMKILKLTDQLVLVPTMDNSFELEMLKNDPRYARYGSK